MNKIRNKPSEANHWLDRPENIKLLWRSFLVVLALTVLAEFFVHLHPAFEVESWFGFHAGFGLFTCALMIIGAKALALLIKRPDNYYADDGDRDD